MTGSNRQDRKRGVGLFGDQPPPVLQQEQAACEIGGAFVSVREWMVTCDGDDIGRRENAGVIHTFVAETVGRTFKRRLQ